MEFIETINVKPRKINIVEGVYSMHPMLIDLYNFKVFLKVGEKEQIRRIIDRDGEAMLKSYVNHWIPMENRYFEKMGIESKCDLVISTDSMEECPKPVE
jgi:uridine kinase